MILYYVRHGDPIYEPDQLTQLGKYQAAAAAKRLALHGIDRIYSSTSTRAMQTAQPLCDLVKKEAVLLDWCNEAYAWEELTLINKRGEKIWCVSDPETKRLFASNEIRRLGRCWHTHPAFVGKNYGAGMTRLQRETDGFLESLGYRHDLENNCYYAENPWEGKAVLFAHAGAGAAILSCMLDIPYPMFAPKFNMGHTGVTVISFAEEKGVVLPEVLTFSNDSHLYREGLPTQY